MLTGWASIRGYKLWRRPVDVGSLEILSQYDFSQLFVSRNNGKKSTRKTQSRLNHRVFGEKIDITIREMISTCCPVSFSFWSFPCYHHFISNSLVRHSVSTYAFLSGRSGTQRKIRCHWFYYLNFKTFNFSYFDYLIVE